MRTEGRRALVTGATGGLGLALVEALCANGYHVRATGRSTTEGDRLRGLGADFVQADLTDESRLESLCRDQEVIFHAAALSRLWGSPQAFDVHNRQVTVHLLAAAQQAGCGCFVFVSSPSIYARFQDQIGLTEADPPATRPLNDYARTKLAAEKAVADANESHFLTVSLRPRAIVGPDDRVLLPVLIALLSRGRIPLLRQGRSLIEMTDVRDVAAALLLADQHAPQLAGGVVNISGGQPVMIGEIARLLADALAIPVSFAPVPVLMARGYALLTEARARWGRSVQEPVLTLYGVATIAYSQTFNMAKAETQLGFHPRHDALQTLLQVARGRLS